VVADNVRNGTRHENSDEGAALTYRAKAPSQLGVLHVILGYILSLRTALEERALPFRLDGVHFRQDTRLRHEHAIA
jgi:hypothetical protein